MLGAIDSECRMIALQLYNGMLKVIPFPLGEQNQTKAFNIRLDELVVLSMVFLTGCQRPTICILSEDPHQRKLKAYEIAVKDKDCKVAWEVALDNSAAMLIAIPQPMGGVIAAGESVISYVKGKLRMNTKIKAHGPWKAYTLIDPTGERILIGDQTGSLNLLVLRVDKDQVTLKCEALGQTSCPASLSYLDNGYFFVGSCFGNSQLVRIHPKPLVPHSDEPSYLEIVDSMNNLGPIVDFCVVDLERQGQGQIVTCSGAFGDGSLRVVRNGIGMMEQASQELAGIKGMWALRAQSHDAFDTYLVLTFVSNTVVLAMVGEELDETEEFTGMDADAQTLHCGNVDAEQVVQVTQRDVRLMQEDQKSLCAQWTPPFSRQINMAAGNHSQILVATGEGNVLQLLTVKDSLLEETQRAELPAQISCIDISPLGPDDKKADLAAVGTWKRQLLLLVLPSLDPLIDVELPGDVIPRSVLLAEFELEPYVLCAMGDGHLVTYHLNRKDAALVGRKVLSLATKPISLRSFRSHDASHVFAASDRPTIIYSSNRKLLYSNLNESEVTVMTPFSPSGICEGLAIAKEGSLTIGTIDEVQKLHVRTFPLQAQPRRIAHQESSRSFMVAVETVDWSGAPPETRLLVIDDQTFETRMQYFLEEKEVCCCLTSCTLGDDPNTYFVVGTSIEEQPEGNSDGEGRILVLNVGEKKLDLVCEVRVKGAVFTILAFQKKLLASISSKVSLFGWEFKKDEGAHELKHLTSHVGRLFVCYLAARGDFIAVADLMRSIEILHYNSESGMLSLRARDRHTKVMTAVTVLDDDCFLGAENCYNLFTVRKNNDSATDEERGNLEVVGEFHLGEIVNRFRAGSLVVRMADQEALHVNTILFGTINGVIGVVASLPQQLFEWFQKLENAMNKVVRGVGNLDHTKWRTFYNEKGESSYRGFIDGDLVEQFLELRTHSQEKVAADMNEEIEEIYRKVEEVRRCCH
eukprot:jgi/Botrbrau1/9805/Bobra.0322s0012.2